MFFILCYVLNIVAEKHSKKVMCMCVFVLLFFYVFYLNCKLKKIKEFNVLIYNDQIKLCFISWKNMRTCFYIFFRFNN